MGFPTAATAASLACMALVRVAPEPWRAALALAALALLAVSLGWLVQDAAARAARRRGRRG